MGDGEGRTSEWQLNFISVHDYKFYLRKFTDNHWIAMDSIILSGMLKEFILRHDLKHESTDKQFEKFTNYCLLKADYYDSFDFEKVGTGECVGVDGIAISIGGVLVDEVADVELFTKAQFSAKFYFTQAKTSSRETLINATLPGFSIPGISLLQFLSS